MAFQFLSQTLIYRNAYINISLMIISNNNKYIISSNGDTMVNEDIKRSHHKSLSLKDIKMVPIPEKIKIPTEIPVSRLLIPSTYAEGDVEYEDDQENNVNLNEATHLRLTAKDRRSDLVVGPTERNGIFKLNVYINNENKAVRKEEATKRREVILNEDYKVI